MAHGCWINTVDANLTRVIWWHCQAFLWKVEPGLNKLLLLLAKCNLDLGGVRVFAVRHNRCASSPIFPCSIFKVFTPSHWLSLPPWPAALWGRRFGATLEGGGEGEGRLGQEMGSRGDDHCDFGSSRNEYLPNIKCRHTGGRHGELPGCVGQFARLWWRWWPAAHQVSFFCCNIFPERKLLVSFFKRNCQGVWQAERSWETWEATRQAVESRVLQFPHSASGPPPLTARWTDSYALLFPKPAPTWWYMSDRCGYGRGGKVRESSPAEQCSVDTNIPLGASLSTLQGDRHHRQRW